MAMIEARKKGGKQIGQDFIERKAKETGHIQRRLSFSGFSRVPRCTMPDAVVHRRDRPGHAVYDHAGPVPK